jgi:hypothetical protein
VVVVVVVNEYNVSQEGDGCFDDGAMYEVCVSVCTIDRPFFVRETLFTGLEKQPVDLLLQEHPWPDT